MSDATSRVKRLRIDRDVVLALLSANTGRPADIVTRSDVVVPNGTDVAEVRYDFMTRSFDFLLTNKEWPAVYYPDPIPDLADPLTIRVTNYRRDDPRPPGKTVAQRTDELVAALTLTRDGDDEVVVISQTEFAAVVKVGSDVWIVEREGFVIDPKGRRRIW